MSTNITAGMVKELRERTGAAMMECKRALVATGNIEDAIKKMREEGIAKADKKSGRTAAEGSIVIKTNDALSHAVMLEINSETDFVARDTNFAHFATEISKIALDKNIKDVETLSAAHLPDGMLVDDARKSLISKLGENIQLRRLLALQCDNTCLIGSYLHGTRIGVLVKMKGGDAALAKDIAMHIAANRPLVVSPDQVSAELVEKEKEIYSVQAKESGKPAEIIAKMIDGRVAKFVDEVSLMGQPFVKDPNQKVSAVLKAKSAEVVEFACFVLGEGIEKETVNFAEEVMAQVRGA
jgi:elongation factor Ts